MISETGKLPPIAIIGTGQVGTALAEALAGTGHAVTLGTRRATDPALVALATRTGARLAPPAEAARLAGIVILALPWAAAETAVRDLGDLSGRIVVDCMNPLGMVDGRPGLLLGHTASGGEMVAGWLPGARVVKTLNQVGAEIMRQARSLPRRPVMFLAGDDDSARTAVAGLLAAIGFEPLDAGPLVRARLLEPLGMVWINQALARGRGRRWALATVDLPS